jgi:excisionase family DNA binding protein
VKTCSAVEASKLLGIGNDTLHRWIHSRKVPAPRLQRVGGLSIRLWTDKDIEVVKKFKAENYWGKGSGRKRSERKK